MDGSYPSGAPNVLDYESWVLRAEEVMVRDLFTRAPGMHSDYPAPTGSLADASELLLDALDPMPMFEGSPEPVENPLVPSRIAEVHAELESALTMIEHLFAALFDAGTQAKVYTAATDYDGEDHPNLLAPFSVVAVAGTAGYLGRRVLYEGECMIEEFSVRDCSELIELHERLRNSVVDGWILREG